MPHAALCPVQQFSKFLKQCLKSGCEALANQLLDLQLIVGLGASHVKIQ